MDDRRWVSTRWRRGCLVCLLASTLGCVSGTLNVAGVAVTPDVLLAGAALGGSLDPTPPGDSKEVLAVTPAMREFLDRTVPPRAAAQAKLRLLARAVVGAESFGLVFEDLTLTASETFRLRRGNCLSFSNLFVALAREVNLRAAFQEVDIPPDWTLDDDVFVLNQHVNVRVDLGSSGQHVVDFNTSDFRSSYDARVISDARARAHYHNNVAVERMRQGDTGAALAHFRAAITATEGRFSPAWTNLGTLYLRAGHSAHAEAAYLQALKMDHKDFVAMSNLARLYERRGEAERTAGLRRKVERHRNQNPYYRYQLAREAVAAERYDDAVRHLRYAVRRKPDDDRFCLLLALSYVKRGDERLGRRWLARAERLAAAEAARRGLPAPDGTPP